MSEVKKADRYNSGKPQLSLVMQGLLEGAARASENGLIKYTRTNWRAGFPDSGLVDCAMRHLVKYMNGEEFDGTPGVATKENSGLCHLDHVAWNIGALLEQRRIRLMGGTMGEDDLIAPMKDYFKEYFKEFSKPVENSEKP